MNDSYPLSETLLETGFSQSMADIYTLLAKTGERHTKDILKDTGLSRPGATDALNYLLSQGYVEYRKDGRHAYYKITHPDKLLSLIEDRKRETAALSARLADAVGVFTGMYNLSQHKPGIRFLEGPEGIREATFDSLRAKDMIYTIIDMDVYLAYAKEMNRGYVEERVKKNIYKKQIVLDTPIARERYQTQPKDRLLEVRFIDAKKNPFKTGIQIYDNTISYSTLTDKAQIGVIIEDENIARTHRALFEYIWDSLAKVPGAVPPLTLNAFPKPPGA